MFRPVGIVVACQAKSAYFLAAGLAFGDLVAGLAFGDFAGLAGLAAFVVALAVVLAGAAFFVAIILGSFGEELRAPDRKTCCLSLVPMQKDNSKSRHSLKSDISSLKLSAHQHDRIVGLFGNYVKRNLLNHKTLSKLTIPQLEYAWNCLNDVTPRDTW